MQNVVRYCEICGTELRGSGITIKYEGSIITVCNSCYSRIKKYSTIYKEKNEKVKSNKKQSIGKSNMVQEFEIVDDYSRIIKNAREKLGMTQKDLANKLKTSENIIKRFESGKLKPTISQARELEKILGVKLVVPVEIEEVKEEAEKYETTLGDIVRIRGEKDEGNSGKSRKV
ncbi:MAG: multiprotein bridging factor aMBF1 [Sulfolobaceae archaeon]